MEKILKTLIALKRDNHYNIKDDLILKNGEIIFVDKTGGLFAKVGDGKTPFKDLPYDLGGIIARGYLKDNVFYDDKEYTSPIVGITNAVYIEIEKSKVYLFDGVNYILFTKFIEQATVEISGVMRLYQNIGANTDGTMSQKAITDELSKKVEVSVNTEDETLILSVSKA